MANNVAELTTTFATAGRARAIEMVQKRVTFCSGVVDRMVQ
ncbi:MAG: hypothetical protein ACYC19_03515 [Acidimicrobiales bacterium]